MAMKSLLMKQLLKLYIQRLFEGTVDTYLKKMERNLLSSWPTPAMLVSITQTKILHTNMRAIKTCEIVVDDW